MCNLSEGVEAKGFVKGYPEGYLEGFAESFVKSYMNYYPGISLDSLPTDFVDSFASSFAKCFVKRMMENYYPTAIKSLMQYKSYTAEKAMAMFEVPKSKWPKYLELLKQNA